MKNKNIMQLLLNAALTLSPAVKGQPIDQPQLRTAGKEAAPSEAFDLRRILMPGMSIGGHTFTAGTTIDSVGLADTGDVAFVARWTDGRNESHAAVFTSQRLVASEGTVIDGRYLVRIPDNATVRINAMGQVAFHGIYADNKEAAHTGAGRIAIYIERRLVGTPPWIVPFRLTDDGEIDSDDVYVPPARAPQKKATLLDRIRVKPPKLPKDAPIAVTPGQTAPERIQPRQRPLGPRPPLYPDWPFPAMQANNEGQFLIPVNLDPDGFMLLLASPVRP